MESSSRSSRTEKIGVYVAVITLIFMFFQAWRDLHLESTVLRERITKCEKDIEYIRGGVK